MFKFVTIVACFASIVCAGPIDSKSEGSNDNGSKNMNLTENSSSNPKAVPNYGGYSVNRQPFPLYSLPPSKPVFGSASRPSLSSPYQGLYADSKTGHLRPQLYQSQPHLYTYPIQSYQSYPQSYYSYSNSYPSLQSYYGNYGYSDYYKQAKEQPELEMAMQSAPATRIVIEKPIATQQFNQIPASPDQQVSGMVARDASGNWSPISYTALPQDNFGQIEDIRRRNILVDDKYNMQIQPSYLMDRLHLQPSVAISKSARDANDLDSSEFGSVAGPEDNVYVIMNQYDQPPVQTAKAALGETFQPTGQMNSIWIPPVFNSPVTPNLRDGNLPYSHEYILNSMNQFYANEFTKQMVKPNQNVSPKARSATQIDDEKLVKALEELLKMVKAPAEKKTESSPPVKPEEKKEVTTSTPKTN